MNGNVAKKRGWYSSPVDDQAHVLAKELIALHPDVLVGNSTPATAALLRER